MGTPYYYQSLGSSPTPYITNESNNDDNSPYTIDHPIHLYAYVTMWIILLVTIIFGTIGNILVLYVYINRKDNKTCTFFIKILAVVDLIICFILAPLELYQMTTGIRNEFLCKFYGFLSTHVLYSTFLITTIAFDRYFCICWPLYKIITIRRAHVIVIICGLLSSLFAIVPMMEHSTKEHILQLPYNHSDALSEISSDGMNLAPYRHVEQMKSPSTMPFQLVNTTDVSCGIRYSFKLEFPKFTTFYRLFHTALYATCILLVFILYTFIYNAVYQRRVTRTRKLSAYRRIIRSYLMNEETEHIDTQSTKSGRSHHHHHHHHHVEDSPSLFTLLCCYCCQLSEDYGNDFKRPSESAFNVPLNERRRQSHHRHMHDEPSSVIIHHNRNKPQVVLEVNGARGKRYSAISMTSMTYLTSGVWDETSPTNLIRSRINSIAATTYCGTEQSSTGRPSTSTEDSIEQASKLLTVNNTLSPSNSIHLTVPGLQATTTSTSVEVINKDNQLNDDESQKSMSQSTNLLHPSYTRKPSNTLSIRQQQRPSDASSVQQRKVSFMTSPGIVDRCISENESSTYQRASLAPPNSSSSQQQQLTVHMNNHRSLSTTSSIDPTDASMRTFSISSTRRPSTFDSETQRTFERQQTQERLANIRTTFTLFIVTATFIIMYLPSIIHSLFTIKSHHFRDVLFLLCYVNSACNPLIYSFFNVNFRNDIRRIYECQKREYLARRY
ncbi:unnamed protein product [Adineta steineri]|uniref:G-protein coupled receptors family 1 profile domain-containing protein n=1 Tax=Adineta steineri TaxID=433720 RepID=A0A813YC27_9BILA|nr:unnamed protein product [Adineta steineri]